MITLRDAIEYAMYAHKEQKDKQGRLYYLHCLRVMLAMDTEEEMIVAVIHDVFEDTDEELIWYKDYFPDTMSAEIFNAIDAITRRKNEKYRDYIIRVSKNELAKKVKIADLRDNLSTIDQIKDEYPHLEGRYREALSYLLTCHCEVVKNEA
jgi:(p)ppGpp synthase/HD superfamily hydrolase